MTEPPTKPVAYPAYRHPGLAGAGKESMSLQLAAAHVIMAVVDEQSSLEAALATYAPCIDARCAPQLREISAGGCRHYHYFNGLMEALMHRPIKERDRLVLFILVSGCYQLEHMRTPHYAVVNESVAAVSDTRFAWATALINGVLRNFLRERPSHDGLSAAARAAFPPWLYEEITTHWPAQADAVIAASNCKPPLTLRVNTRKTTRDAYLGLLAQHEMAATPTTHSALGVTLAQPQAVADIPGFADGLVSVQDEAAQLAVEALGAPRAAERVLDGCAAPGGKTAQLLEAAPPIETLVALDTPRRSGAITATLERLGLSAEVVSGNLTAAQEWWDGRPFHRIMLDVPCSGSGVLRRHPDIKHRRRAADLARFATYQLRLLHSAWALLEAGGTLAYITCSILPQENDQVIAAFLRETPHATAQPLPTIDGIATAHGCQRLPGVHPGDGFYYCALQKAAAP